MKQERLVADDGFNPHRTYQGKSPPDGVEHECRANKRVGKYQCQIWQKGDTDVYNIKVWDVETGIEMWCFCADDEVKALAMYTYLGDEAEITKLIETT